jgi:hypothetical protein
MQTVFNLLLRVVLLAAGLVFAASLAVVAAALLALWGVRAVWCKLTGQPINPFVVRMRPGAGFDTVFRTRQNAPADARPTKPGRVGMDDVTDVEPKR